MPTPAVRLNAAQCVALAGGAASFDVDPSHVSPPADRDAVLSLTTWRIPKVSPEGTCSRPDDLMPEPFDLVATLHGRKAEELPLDHPLLKRLSILKAVVDALVAITNADWVGVYRTVEGHPATPSKLCLVKEAYFGAPSRPFFPLTEEFARHSNNSTVAMTKEACIIADTRDLDDDEPYYICDGKVRSELCAPILDPKTGACIGIIDAESFKPKHFGSGTAGDDEAAVKRTMEVLRACQKLGEWGLFADMLTS